MKSVTEAMSSKTAIVSTPEMNALLEASGSKTTGGSLYYTHFNSIDCAKSIIQSGIQILVYSRIDTVNQVIEQLLSDACSLSSRNPQQELQTSTSAKV